MLNAIIIILYTLALLLIISLLIIIPLKKHESMIIKKKARCTCHCTGKIVKISQKQTRVYDTVGGNMIKTYYAKVNFKVDKSHVSAVSFESCPNNKYKKGEIVEVYYNPNDLFEIYIQKKR